MIIVLCGCKNHSPLALNIFNEDSTYLVLKNWHVVGPFTFSKEGNNLDIDNLNNFGYSENEINYKEFAGLDSTKAKNKELLNPKFRSITGSNDNPVLKVNQVFDPKDINNANAYMGCLIRSSKETTVRLNFSSDNGAKVWLNNELILNYDKELSVFAYEHYIPVKLNKGDNFLLVKVYNSSGDWLMYARIEKESESGLKHHQRIQALLNNRNFLKKSILDTINYLEANNSLPFNDYRLSISDSNNKEVFNEQIKIKKDWKKDVSFLSEGLYKARLSFYHDTLEQLFYKGDAVARIQERIAEKRNDLPINDKNDLDANMYRLNHLLKPQNRGSNFAEKQSWQKKIVYLYRDISSIINNSNHSLKDEPGLHIRTYVSEIDNHPQYYIAHVPKNYKKSESYPVVFLIPFKVTYNYHYLESMRAADLQLIENMQDIADKNNVIAIEPFFREVGIPTFNGIEETDFFEVLKAVEKDYKIKKDQLYFIGSCEGAHKALKLAVKYPDVPAALGFISPIYSESYGYGTRNQWIANNEPMNYLKNLRNTPISIIHSKLDGHVSISVTEGFADTYKNSGLTNLAFTKLDDVVDQYYWTQYSDDLVKSLLKHKKNNNPKKISISTTQLKTGKSNWLKIKGFQKTGIGSIDAELQNDNTLNIVSNNIAAFSIDTRQLPYNKNNKITIIENNKTLFTGKPSKDILTFHKENRGSSLLKTDQVEGPFCDAFLHKFIIVIGKQGSNEENTKLKALGDSLSTMWKYKYWNDCIVKYDTDITSTDISNANLILLGNAQSNLLIKKIIHKLPLLVSKGEVSLNGLKAQGSNLGFYMVYPNPLNTNKYVAIIGYNNPDHFTLGPVDLNENDYKDLYSSGWVRNPLQHIEISCYGWFDYRIWDSRTNEIIHQGYFGPLWD